MFFRRVSHKIPWFLGCEITKFHVFSVYFSQNSMVFMDISHKILTLTDSTLHFSCYFTKLLHSHFIPLLNHFTMQEKCY